MGIREKGLRELHRKALELAEKLSEEEEKKLIREIVELSPNSITYLGYIPVHVQGTSETCHLSTPKPRTDRAHTTSY